MTSELVYCKLACSNSEGAKSLTCVLSDHFFPDHWSEIRSRTFGTTWSNIRSDSVWIWSASVICRSFSDSNFRNSLGMRSFYHFFNNIKKYPEKSKFIHSAVPEETLLEKATVISEHFRSDYPKKWSHIKLKSLFEKEMIWDEIKIAKKLISKRFDLTQITSTMLWV